MNDWITPVVLDPSEEEVGEGYDECNCIEPDDTRVTGGVAEIFEDEGWCDICKAKTMRTFYLSGHERDSTNDWQHCHVCKGRWSGYTGTWEKYQSEAK